MENTKQNIQHFRTSLDPEVSANPKHQSNQGNYVFWRVNIKELFGVDLSYPGVKSALNKAFTESKKFVPVDTGLTKRSMTMKQLNDYMVEVFFDPKKIIGQKRKGVIIKENYTIYIAESPKRWNWISICMYHFYTTLFKEMKHQQKMQQNKQKQQQKAQAGQGDLNFIGAATFMSLLKAGYKEKKDEAIRLRKEQREKRKLKEEAIKEKKRLRRLKNESIKDLDQED